MPGVFSDARFFINIQSVKGKKQQSGRRVSNRPRPLFNSQLQSLLSICYKQHLLIVNKEGGRRLPFLSKNTAAIPLGVDILLMRG